MTILILKLYPVRYEDVLYLEDGGDEDHLQPYLPTVLKVCSEINFYFTILFNEMFEAYF